jgi:hypothetical protein
MTMWRPNEPVEEDGSNLVGIDPQSKRRRSDRRAWRDGLADQTVVRNLEDARAYRAFERALVGSIDPRSVIELALAHRLASLMWRLRRASAIETGLFEMQGELLLAARKAPSHGPRPATDQELLSRSIRPPLGSNSRAIVQCFLRLSNLHPTLLDRVGSYETRLWRQAAQTIWTLDAMRRPPPAPTRRPFRKSVARFYWNAEK